MVFILIIIRKGNKRFVTSVLFKVMHNDLNIFMKFRKIKFNNMDCTYFKQILLPLK